jgi:hypothetical protein
MVTRHRLRVIEAACALSLARLLLRVLPFSRIARRAGTTDAGEDAPARVTSDSKAAAVGAAVDGAAARLPWYSSCLVRALAGRLMLARRRIPSTLVLGVAKDAETLHAHAWLIAAGGTVCGGREVPDFHPIAALRGKPRRRAPDERR